MFLFSENQNIIGIFEMNKDIPEHVKIEKALKSGEDFKKPSREKILERLKASGLPTKI